MRSVDKPWVIEEFDAHWGGWRRVRAGWDTEEPARLATEAEAQEVAAGVRDGRPWAKVRVVQRVVQP